MGTSITTVLGVWLETGSHRGLLDASLTPPPKKKSVSSRFREIVRYLVSREQHKAVEEDTWCPSLASMSMYTGVFISPRTVHMHVHMHMHTQTHTAYTYMHTGSSMHRV